ncbi:T9SS type A sorting domain-containing protein [bacterium SCSIO 12643]|nr:T9SS type A sorting domain-containing protein [bacterium SCSIO 12643]
MKKVLLILMLIVAIKSHAQNTTQILFIGNSITYYNNMPQTFESIANSLGDTTEVTVYAPGGTGFVNHVNDPNVYNHFMQKQWDYIVLQPGSNESPGYSFPIEITYSRAQILLDSIYKYNPCTQVLFYEISYGVWGNSTADLVTYNNTMSAIKTNLEYLVDSTNTFFAPVGEVFRHKWNTDQNDILWGGFGDIHPNDKGSYVAACTFYSSIFQKPSLGTSEISSLTLSDANQIQKLSDSVVLNHFSNWRINTYNQVTDFSYTIQSDTVLFTNTSQNIDSLTWDFGDGTYSNLSNPSHVFHSTGSFEISLTTYQNGCEQVKKDTIHILSIDHFSNTFQWQIYPNPVSDVLYIENNKKGLYLYKIYNANGQLIYSGQNHIIPVSTFESGHYFIQRIGKTDSQVKRFIVW